MKSCSWRLMFISILFAISIYEGEAAKLNNANRKQNHQQSKTLSARTAARRISEIKCFQYLQQRNRPKREFESEFESEFELSDPHTLVLGGRHALQGEFPHMGALGWRAVTGTWIFKCGSSLISPKFAVTAAHCSKIKKDGKIAKSEPEIVRLGERNIIDVLANGVYPVDAHILKIIVHPRYSPPNKYYDIALIQFKSEVQFSNTVQPVCLWSKFNTSELGTKFSTTGWGVIDTAKKITSPILQAAVLDIIDSKQCTELLRRFCNRNWCGIQQHQLCAGKLTGGKDACQGDSGGPLQVKVNVPISDGGTMHYLIGVTSFGIGCARPNQPGVYTRVSSFIDWIEKTVWPGQ